MTKITLNNIGSGTPFQTAIATINANNDAIETAWENNFSRDGTSPNTLSTDLDVNSNRILNLPQALSPTEPVRLQEIGNAPQYAADAAASAAAASSSASAASGSASAASTSASNAATSASNASTSASNAAASAVLSATNATVVVGNEYAFSTTTTMADPGTGLLRFNNATVSSATAIAISATTNASGNPNIRSYINTWDDASNAQGRGNLLITKIGTPSTFAVFKISGATTDNTTWLQLTLTHVTSSGTWSASDRMSIQFSPAGNDGALSGPGVSVDSEIAIWNGTGGTSLKRASTTGIVKATSGVISAAVSGTDYCAATSGSSVLKGSSGNTTAATAGTDYVAPATATAFTAQQSFTLATITDAANLAWTVSSGQKAKVTLGGNRTMNAVTGAVEGATYTLWVIQDATGSRTISWTTTGAGSFDFGTAGAPTLTTTASRADLLTFEAITTGGVLKLRFSGIARGFA